MARRSDNMDDLFEIKVYVDVAPTVMDADYLYVNKYHDYIGAKMPGYKRYVGVLYIPKPEAIKPDRVIMVEMKEV